MEFRPRVYQTFAHKAIVERCGLFLMLDMGLGKTVLTLGATLELLDGFKVFKPLIIAPKKVLESTWPDEIEKWDHLRGLTYSSIHGTEKRRIAALNTPADIYLCSRDNIAWLVKYMGRRFDFDFLIVDESSSFKNADSKRFKAIRSVRGHFKRVLLLSGTPVSNDGLLDLWSQLYLMDGGERLERTLGGYRTRYFNAVYRDDRIKYEIRQGSEAAIKDRISDVCISMQASDWLDLPPRIDITQPIALHNLPEYKKFIRDRVLDMGGEKISPDNAGALYTKSLQFCNGAVYHEDGKTWTEVGTDKLDALEEFMEVMDGAQVLIFYNFRSDVERIIKRMPFIRPMSTDQDIRDWNAKRTRGMLLHPASGGHGLNLQDGGHIMAWFGLPASWELYKQSIHRIDRQGQKASNVFNRRMIAKGTVEEKVASRLEGHGITSQELIDYFKAMI